jgi:hypothetical protein
LAGNNTATASWDTSQFNTPDASAANTSTYAFGSPSVTLYQTVTATDTFNGGKTKTLGTVTATSSQPYASATFTQSNTVTITTKGCKYGCKSYTNVANLVETGQSASVTVEACGALPSGAKNMNYWNGATGQGIITNGKTTKTVCQSGTWLRGYAPFQDLSATATCSGVASYVTGVINAATASGATMNARLKGQMLSTSLDVYFSDKNLGGNKISAPNPVGQENIDTTLICSMTDNPDGTASCSNTFEDASSAFNSTGPTISSMLSYAASQSNVGGSTWYGNVTATQTLAKDAFDAINNVVAFYP